MKKSYLILIISICIPVLSFFFPENENFNKIQINSSQPNNNFLIGATESGIDGDYSHHNELRFNTWHKYGKWTNSAISWFQGDSLNASLSVYQSTDLKLNFLLTDKGATTGVKAFQEAGIMISGFTVMILLKPYKALLRNNLSK